MKTDRNILVAFLLNLGFSVFEFLGGIFTGSIAIISDAIHDIGDAISIGISYVLEKKSRKQPDDIYTYGYIRYSVLGGLITTVILLAGSVVVIYNAVERIFKPVAINYSGMILFAVFGTAVNLFAAWFTRDGDSLNQRAVNLHMLEDVLGWIVVLVGAIVMKFTGFVMIDSILSIGVALFILVNAWKNLAQITGIFLEKIPEGVELDEIKEHILKIEGVLDVHHIHIRSLDGNLNYATMHIVVKDRSKCVKKKVKEELSEHNICHSTIEIEFENEECEQRYCHIEKSEHNCHHHHHH